MLLETFDRHIRDCQTRIALQQVHIVHLRRAKDAVSLAEAVDMLELLKEMLALYLEDRAAYFEGHAAEFVVATSVPPELAPRPPAQDTLG
jgi:hypothetical protein